MSLYLFGVVAFISAGNPPPFSPRYKVLAICNLAEGVSLELNNIESLSWILSLQNCERAISDLLYATGAIVLCYAPNSILVNIIYNLNQHNELV